MGHYIPRQVSITMRLGRGLESTEQKVVACSKRSGHEPRFHESYSPYLKVVSFLFFTKGLHVKKRMEQNHSRDQ